MISVVILTLNEEIDLPSCIHSVRWSNDIQILDSGSTDKTIEIAKQHPISITHHPFQSFGGQRNYALDFLQIKNEWILFLDADEVVTDKFYMEMIEAVKNAQEEVAGFYCCWKMILEGKWLKRCDNFPKWQFRLMRKGRARFTDIGHGQKEGDVKGRIDYIKEPYLHYSFSKGWRHWIERHNKYSSLEAEARLNNIVSFGDIFYSNKSIRNIALKSLLSKLPGWPIFRFFYTYIIKFGFLEGIPGFVYCANMGYYEFLIQIKIRELKIQKDKRTKRIV